MRNENLEISEFESYIRKNFRRKSKVLLINPPVEEVRYNWIRWNQPLDLLKMSTYLKSLGIKEVKFFDFMLPDSRGKANKTKVEDKREINGQLFTIWRFGIPWGDFKKTLQGLIEKEKWIPDFIIITSLTSYWINTINELVNNHIRQWTQLAESRILIYGNFPVFERNRLGLLAGINGAITQKLDLRNYNSDLMAYRTFHAEFPRFAALDVRSDNLSQEIDLALRCGVKNFAFFNDDIFCDTSKLTNLEKLKTSKNIGFHGICGIWPHRLSTQELDILKRLGFKSIFLEHDVDEEGRLNLVYYEKIAHYLRKNRLIRSSQYLGAFVNIGLPNDNVERIVYHTMILNHLFGSVILKPFGFSQDVSQKYGVELPDDLRPQDKSAQVLPYSRFNGLAPEDYQNLYRWQGFINMKAKGRTLDFLENTLFSRCFRKAIIEEEWRINATKSSSVPTTDLRYSVLSGVEPT